MEKSRIPCPERHLEGHKTARLLLTRHGPPLTIPTTLPPTLTTLARAGWTRCSMGTWPWRETVNVPAGCCDASPSTCSRWGVGEGEGLAHTAAFSAESQQRNGGYNGHKPASPQSRPGIFNCEASAPGLAPAWAWTWSG